MSRHPSTDQLLEAVAEFLRERVAPQLAGQDAFHARVAANMLDIVRRELVLAPEADRGRLDGLRALLGCDGNLDALEALLCERLAAGELDASDPRVAARLWSDTLAAVAIDQPGYDTYRRLKGRAGESSDP